MQLAHGADAKTLIHAYNREKQFKAPIIKKKNIALLVAFVVVVFFLLIVLVCWRQSDGRFDIFELEVLLNIAVTIDFFVSSAVAAAASAATFAFARALAKCDDLREPFALVSELVVVGAINDVARL